MQCSDIQLVGHFAVIYNVHTFLFFKHKLKFVMNFCINKLCHTFLFLNNFSHTILYLCINVIYFCCNCLNIGAVLMSIKLVYIKHINQLNMFIQCLV